MKQRRQGLSGDLLDELGDGDGGHFVLPRSTTRIVRQPGDGTCLFHSLAYGLVGKSGRRLRQDICEYIERHPRLSIAGEPLRKWVQWASGRDVWSYASHMRSRSAWGGGIELVVFVRKYKRNVHVYEKVRGGYKRISRFNTKNAAEDGTTTFHLLYSGRAHYDVLVPMSGANGRY